MLIQCIYQLSVYIQVQQEIERFKSQNIEMEEKRKAILKELEVRVKFLYNMLDCNTHRNNWMKRLK